MLTVPGMAQLLTGFVTVAFTCLILLRSGKTTADDLVQLDPLRQKIGSFKA